jgi:hypothetical protein
VWMEMSTDGAKGCLVFELIGTQARQPREGYVRSVRLTERPPHGHIWRQCLLEASPPMPCFGKWRTDVSTLAVLTGQNPAKPSLISRIHELMTISHCGPTDC